MGEKFIFPEVIMKNTVISSDYHCADALLLEVRGGTEALAFESVAGGSAVTLNGESLFFVNEERFCPTCGGLLYRGYGERTLSMDQAMAFSDQINAPYAGIRRAAERMRPLLGLLKSGHYVVADYALFPFTDGSYFWHYLGIPQVFTCWHDRMGMEAYFSRNCPACMIPSQRPAGCDPERIEHYIRQLESRNYPRAIGLYAAGDTVLLLDGHHKAAAAASQGRMVHCLVIMSADISEGDAVKIGSGPLLQHEGMLLDDGGDPIARVYPCLSRNLKDNSEHRIPDDGDFEAWGSIPEKYVPDRGAYEEIPHQEMLEWIWSGKDDSYDIARDIFRGTYEAPRNKRLALNLLCRHQAQFNALSGGVLTPRQMPLLTEKQFGELNRAARKYGIDRDPKTANAVYGCFSFLPGQRRIRDIPPALEWKLKHEVIRTVLIPKSVREVDSVVFRHFPDLEDIVLEKGNPWLKPEVFREIARQARSHKEDKLHLKQYPFADLAEMLKKKQEQQ